MEVFGHVTPIQMFNDHDRLIAQRPSYYTNGRAEQEAHYLWMEYVKEWFPDEYAKIPNGRQSILFNSDTLMRAKLYVTDGQWHWPIVKFNCEADDDEGEDLEVLASSAGQNSDENGSDNSSNGSQ